MKEDIDYLIKETLEECNDWLIVEEDCEMCVDLLKKFYSKLLCGVII